MIQTNCSMAGRGCVG